MTANLIPCVAAFVSQTRDLLKQGLAEDAVWSKTTDNLSRLLKEQPLRDHARNWPETRFPGQEPRNLLFYEDPDYGFVLNALIKAPNTATFVHDHGSSWTLYGVLEGAESVERFDRIDDPGAPSGKKLVQRSSHSVDAGFVDAVGPWQIHRETTRETRTVAFIVRSKRCGTFAQFRYDPETAVGREGRGPIQVPYELA